MKTAFAILVVSLTLFFAFVYFHGKSIDRAHLINSADALLVAQEQLRRHRSSTNASASIRVYGVTNQVTVDGAEYFAELAADVPGLTNTGRLVLATDGTLLWIDRRNGPVVMRGPDGRIVIPQRFRDF